MTHHGIERRPDRRKPPLKPLTETHKRVLAAMTDGEIARPTPLADELGLGLSTLTSSMHVLARRGLVRKVPYKGWERIAS